VSDELVLEGGLVFDGRGGPGVVADVRVVDGVVVEVGPGPLARGPGAEVVDVRGRWVTPGFVDMHTHYDAELEVAPALTESLRHGVTTVLTGSCSLSLVLGAPRDLADMFCRVEAIPRDRVLPLLERVKDWDSPASYLEHLDGLNLGPNVACFLGHSTIRAAAMGLERSLTAGLRPDAAEWARMEGWLAEALDAGFVGLSISTLPWDKMDGDETATYRSRPMPSVFAGWREYARLASILRARGRVLQAIPNISTKLNVPLFFLLSAGLFFGRALKTSLLSMMDVRSDRLAFRLAGWIARAARWFLGADVRMQALPEPFDLWADGVDLVVFEEFAAGAAALHLRDATARRDLLADPAYRARFKRDWRRRFVPRAFHRDLSLAQAVACPDPTVVGRTFAELGRARGVDPIDAFLDLVVDHGPALRWYTVMGNDRPEWLQWIVSHPDVTIGFSDAGAHLRNMAHYNYPLRLLRLVRDAERAGRAFMTVGRAVERLTSELADWLGLDAGTLAPGRRADLVVVDPTALDASLEAIHEEEAPGMGLRRLVRRNDAAVPLVVVGGRVAWRDGAAADDLGARPFGRVLRAGAPSRARVAEDVAPARSAPLTSVSPVTRGG
jgi:N-acyl-D-aspartate/D-glutamate deacylase